MLATCKGKAKINALMSEATVHSTNETSAVGEAQAPVTESIPTQTITTENQGRGGLGEAENSIQGRIQDISDTAEYDALMSEVQSNPQMLNQPEPQELNQSEEDEVPSEGVSQGGNEEDQVIENQGVANEGDEKFPQYRLRPKKEVDAEALRIMKAADAADSPVSLEEALSLAKKRLGIKDSVEPETKTPQNQEQSDYDETDDGDDAFDGITYSDVKNSIKDLRKQHSQALRDGDLDAAADIMDQLSDSEDLLEVIAEKEQKTQSQVLKQKNDAFASSIDKASDVYPDFMNEGSEFYKLCSEIDESLRDTQDPRYFDPNKPFLVAQMAAKELNLAPRRASAATSKPVATQQPQSLQPKTASPQPPRTEKFGQIPAASGASRTQGNPNGAATTLAEQVAVIRTPEDFDRLAEQAYAARR